MEDLPTFNKKDTCICRFDTCNDDEDGYNYDYFISELQHIINKTGIKKGFYVEGENLDWRNSSGSMVVECTDAQVILNKIMPGTNDVTIEVHKQKDKDCKFLIKIFHHDCPLGSRMYFYSLNYLAKNVWGDIKP